MGELVILAISGRWSTAPARANLLAATRGNTRRDQRARRWLTALDAVELRAFGRTQDEVGRLMGDLSRQRVELATGLPVHDLLIAEWARRRHARTLDVFERSVALLQSSPGLSPEAVAARVGASPHELEAVLGPGLVRALAVEPRDVPVRWSTEECVRALRAVAATRPADSLTAPYYDSVVTAGGIRGPSAATIRARFGTWREALEGADLPTREWSGGLRRHWSNDDVREAVVEYLLTTPVVRWSAEDYAASSAHREDLPSLSLMKLRFPDGTWRRLKVEALRACAHPDRHDRYLAVITPAIDERRLVLAAST